MARNWAQNHPKVLTIPVMDVRASASLSTGVVCTTANIAPACTCHNSKAGTCTCVCLHDVTARSVLTVGVRAQIM